MIVQADKKHYSTQEYLELELASEARSEYRDGEIVPMTGGTPNHNDIAGNLYILLKTALKTKNYRTFYTDQRLWIPAVNLYTYPDVMVVPKPIELQTGRTDTVVNPCLIAEVLSKSTQNHDRGEKFVAYRTISSFQEYVLIDQYRIRVEHHVRTAVNQWLLSEFDDPTATLTLGAVGVEIQIAQLYEGIDFSET
ncbi:Uma2 family endonuclease [Leptolyngbya sp. AN03gr2]|uniref:Uma2 family endonuclease n=1 Tax=unclassified Leptolyngbya TaxID=2650499 RepID=UPI003D31BEF7